MLPKGYVGTPETARVARTPTIRRSRGSRIHHVTNRKSVVLVGRPINNPTSSHDHHPIVDRMSNVLADHPINSPCSSQDHHPMMDLKPSLLVDRPINTHGSDQDLFDDGTSVRHQQQLELRRSETDVDSQHDENLVPYEEDGGDECEYVLGYSIPSNSYTTPW
ncbi:hypothetical protein Aduo_018524 [Ancylostoma duodenale]